MLSKYRYYLLIHYFGFFEYDLLQNGAGQTLVIIFDKTNKLFFYEGLKK